MRFDPLIAIEDFEEIYQDFFQKVFQRINLERLHSVTLGEFRLPQNFFKTMHALYPDEKLFNNDFEERDDMVSYKKTLACSMRNFCEERLMHYITSDIYFPTPSSSEC